MPATKTSNDKTLENGTKSEDLYQDDLSRVFQTLSSSVDGLSQSDAQERQTEYGLNQIQRLKKVPIVLTFASNFTHMMALLLWAGGVIALVAKMHQLAIAIWLVNIINGLFSFWQEYKAERATEALLRLVPKRARVIRDKTEVSLPAEEIVPGDVIIVEEGDEIAADARVITDKGLFVNQSLLTGESAPVRKTACQGIPYHHPNRGHADVLFAGTSVTAGQAKALVISTGMQSRFGRIAHLTQSIRGEDSPLQKEMARVTKTVTLLAVAIGVAFFLIAVAILDVNYANSFVFALGMIVAFVPEGMLPTVSLSLAMAVQQMSARNALVKRLSSVETLGCTTIICSDKTGTLTRNEMMVTDIWCPDQQLTLTGSGYEPIGLIRTADGTILTKSAPQSLIRIMQAGVSCCNARMVEPEAPGKGWSIIGDPTEAAILVANAKLRSILTQGGCAPATEATMVDCIAFDPNRKRMSTLWSEGGRFVSYVKGAPKELLELSCNVFDGASEVGLHEEIRLQILDAVDRYAESGLRVLAIAVKYFDEKPPVEEQYLETELTFLGLVAMLDPLHEEVPDALFRCHEAGIRVIMITGDYELTAASIAKQAGIITSNQAKIVSGQKLKSLGDDELLELLKGEVVFARTKPEDKLRIVKALQSQKHIVAVTGDGVNDAPALKQADIGIAMGKAGTDVARESADIVLSDDNFASIVAAVELGRAVYDNIRKFAAYVFTSNVAEAAPFAVMLFSRGLVPLPLTLMQVLLIDLGTDMVPAIGLGADPPDSDVMRKPPRNPNERLLSRRLLTKVFLWYGLIEAIACLSAYFCVNWLYGWPSQNGLAAQSTPIYQIATTAALSAVVFCQVGTVLCCRSSRASVFSRSIADNRLLVVGIGFELALLVLVMFLPQLKGIFGTEALPLHVVPFVVIWLPIIVLLDELRKWMLRLSEKSKIRR